MSRAISVYLESTSGDGRRHRFWSVQTQGRQASYRWGRIGHKGSELVIEWIRGWKTWHEENAANDDSNDQKAA